MTLKWGAVVVAAVSVTIFVTANTVVAVSHSGDVPLAVNMVAIAVAGVATVLAVLAEMYSRVNGRITALAEFLAVRLNELDDHTRRPSSPSGNGPRVAWAKTNRTARRYRGGRSAPGPVPPPRPGG
jgi:hypothetical protein